MRAPHSQNGTIGAHSQQNGTTMPKWRLCLHLEAEGAASSWTHDAECLVELPPLGVVHLSLRSTATPLIL